MRVFFPIGLADVYTGKTRTPSPGNHVEFFIDNQQNSKQTVLPGSLIDDIMENPEQEKVIIRPLSFPPFIFCFCLFRRMKILNQQQQSPTVKTQNQAQNRIIIYLQQTILGDQFFFLAHLSLIFLAVVVYFIFLFDVYIVLTKKTNTHTRKNKL